MGGVGWGVAGLGGVGLGVVGWGWVTRGGVCEMCGAQISNVNGTASRPRLGSICLPQVRMETGQDPGKAGLDARDPQLADNSGFVLGAGIPYGAPK
jgi:hypothetical protein